MRSRRQTAHFYALEEFEPRRLFSGEIEVLTTGAAWSTASNNTFTTAQGVHVRVASSFLDAHDPTTFGYRWDFAESSSAYNNLPGFNAAHVYNGTGTFSIALTVTDPSSGTPSSTTYTLPVVVSSPTWTKTYYVSSAGSDSNNGESSGAPFLTIDKAIDTANARSSGDTIKILLRQGDTINVPGSNSSITHSNLLITSDSSYSTGPADAALQWTNTTHNDFFSTGSGTKNVTFANIQLSAVLNGSNRPDNMFIPRGDNFVAKNIVFDHGGYFAQANTSGASGMLFQNCFAQSNDATKEYGVFAGGGTENLTLLGDVFKDSPNQSNIRTYSDYVNIYGCTVTNTTSHAPNPDADPSVNTLRANLGSYIYWSHNTINGGVLLAGLLGSV